MTTLAGKSFAWSYSALQAFETCPWRYYLTKVAKTVTEPQTEATSEGQRVHKAMQLHVEGKQWLPDKYKQWTVIADRVKNMPGTIVCEQKIALTESFEPTTYFGKDVWLRLVFDVAIKGDKEVILLDWKTGKRKSDTDQLELFAAAGFEVFPRVEKIRTGYVWLHANKIDPEVYHRDNKPALWKGFLIRVERMKEAYETGEFPKKPSGLCKQWCPVGKHNCEYCGT
jgi:hypothetical protein